MRIGANQHAGLAAHLPQKVRNVLVADGLLRVDDAVQVGLHGLCDNVHVAQGLDAAVRGWRGEGQCVRTATRG